MQCFCTCVCFHVFYVFLCFSSSLCFCVCSFSMDLHGPIQNKERKEKKKEEEYFAVGAVQVQVQKHNAYCSTGVWISGLVFSPKSLVVALKQAILLNYDYIALEIQTLAYKTDWYYVVNGTFPWWKEWLLNGNVSFVAIKYSGVGTGGSGGSMNRGPELLGPRVVGPQNNFRQDS